MPSHSAAKGWLAHYRELLGTWARRASSPYDAEDAVQGVALTLLESEGRPMTDARRYFRRAVFNRSVSQYRAEARQAGESIDTLPEHLCPTDHGPEAAYEANETLRIMLAALAELPTACQDAFKLRQLEGLDNAEIARRLGVSRNMVERHMIRITRHLQSALQSRS